MQLEVLSVGGNVPNALAVREEYPHARCRRVQSTNGSFLNRTVFIRHAGDVVIGVDGEDVVGQSLDVIISKIRGPRGTVVVLTVQRADAPSPIDITITRARIEIPIVEFQMLEGDIAYIHLTSFHA